VTASVRRAAALLALAVAIPAAAYVLPPAAILRFLGERRAALGLDALEVTGSLQIMGPSAERLVAAGAPRSANGDVEGPARFLMKVPGRCRLELVRPEVPEAERPYVAVRDGKLSGRGGLEAVPSAAALVRAACTLLAVPVAGNASAAYAAALGRRGVALTDATLGRFDGRLAYVIGGRARDAKPLVFVDKDAYQPLRLIAAEGGALQDVRMLGWGAPTGGDWFPRAVEVVEKEAVRIRFTTERAQANPKIGEGSF
jgi:hypothetical protein